jgi:uncharacterized circularly permuted ATP-grasp superfamily protein
MGETPAFFNEMDGAGDRARAPYARYAEWLQDEPPERLRRKAREAETFFRRTGITFNVYGSDDADERLIPFDIVPRIIAAKEWARLTRGIEQRVRAINAFLSDIYHRQEIIRAGRVPVELIENNDAFLPKMLGVSPPGGVYTHIVGVDLVRTGENEFFVLEDNARTPSGVSYMLENRETMLQMFPELFTKIRVRPVSDYPKSLRRSLSACAPPACKGRPVVAVLTPGIHNSAYYEHAFLADQMGAELVEGHDLRVVDGRIAMRTTMGYTPIDVLYRRVDDDYPRSAELPPGFLPRRAGYPRRLPLRRHHHRQRARHRHCRRQGDLLLHAGHRAVLYRREADPEERAHLALLGAVVACLCARAPERTGGEGSPWVWRLRHARRPAASRKELEAFRAKLTAKPSNYIAQPTLALSTVPILTRSGLAPRHVDLRPFVLMSPDGIEITPGGLTRVALKKGSLVVNSSQGGGTKDTWVLED